MERTEVNNDRNKNLLKNVEGHNFIAPPQQFNATPYIRESSLECSILDDSTHIIQLGKFNRFSHIPGQFDYGHFTSQIFTHGHFNPEQFHSRSFDQENFYFGQFNSGIFNPTQNYPGQFDPYTQNTEQFYPSRCNQDTQPTLKVEEYEDTG